MLSSILSSLVSNDSSDGASFGTPTLSNALCCSEVHLILFGSGSPSPAVGLPPNTPAVVTCCPLCCPQPPRLQSTSGCRGPPSVGTRRPSMCPDSLTKPRRGGGVFMTVLWFSSSEPASLSSVAGTGECSWKDALFNADY